MKIQQINKNEKIISTPEQEEEQMNIKRKQFGDQVIGIIQSSIGLGSQFCEAFKKDEHHLNVGDVYYEYTKPTTRYFRHIPNALANILKSTISPSAAYYVPFINNISFGPAVIKKGYKNIFHYCQLNCTELKQLPNNTIITNHLFQLPFSICVTSDSFTLDFTRSLLSPCSYKKTFKSLKIASSCWGDVNGSMNEAKLESLFCSNEVAKYSTFQEMLIASWMCHWYLVIHGDDRVHYWKMFLEANPGMKITMTPNILPEHEKMILFLQQACSKKDQNGEPVQSLQDVLRIISEAPPTQNDDPSQKSITEFFTPKQE